MEVSKVSKTPSNINNFVPCEAVIKVNAPDQGEVSEESKPVDDSGLTLLGDFCKKTVATVYSG